MIRASTTRSAGTAVPTGNFVPPCRTLKCIVAFAAKATRSGMIQVSCASAVGATATKATVAATSVRADNADVLFRRVWRMIRRSTGVGTQALETSAPAGYGAFYSV